jgi:hypothetical protein
VEISFAKEIATNKQGQVFSYPTVPSFAHVPTIASPSALGEAISSFNRKVVIFNKKIAYLLKTKLQ